MGTRQFYRRDGMVKTKLDMVSIPEDTVLRTASTLKATLMRTPLDDQDLEESLADTISRMSARESTFITQIDEDGRDSEAMLYDSEEYNSDLDENHNDDVRRRGRRKYPAFDIDREFTFTQADEEEIRSRSKTKKITTDMVYAKACERSQLTPCSHFQSQLNKPYVELRGMHLGPKEIKPLAISMVKDRTIATLDVSENNMGPMGLMYIAEMMQANRNLLELNLSCTNPGSKGLAAIAETLRLNNSLRSLKLEGNDIEPSMAPHIASIMQTCTKLQELYLGHNKLGSKGGKDIAQALVTNTGLSTLDLQWNHLRRESAVEISKALEKNKTLRLLNVAWNGWGREGCMAMSRHLPKNKGLQELDLTSNRIDYTSLNFLTHGICEHGNLRTVKLGHNPMTTQGANDLLKALERTFETQQKANKKGGNSGIAKELPLEELMLDGVPVDGEFIGELTKLQNMRRKFRVTHGHIMKLATTTRNRDSDGVDLSKWEPALVLFEYMRMDNLRLIDMFKSFDVKKRDKLSRADLKAGINTIKLPLTEHMLDEFMEKVDVNKDRKIDLEEMMKAAKEISRYVNQRVLKAKAKGREDQGLIALRSALKGIIKKRQEDQEEAAQKASKERMDKRRQSLLSNVLEKMKPKKKTPRDTNAVVKDMATWWIAKVRARLAQMKAIKEEDEEETFNFEEES